MVLFKILFLFFLSVEIFGQIYPDKKIDSLLKIGINEIISQNYKTADSIFQKLDENYSNLPLGKIYLAAVEITKSVDYEEDLNQSYVDSLLQLAEKKTDNLLDKDDENIWFNYFYSLIYGYRAYYYSLTGSLVSAFADGVVSIRSLQNCLSLNKNFYEAYIALGTYNYWKSAQVKSMLWMPFVHDNRDEGIEYLEKAIKENSYNKHLAAYSLVWIYIDYGQPEKAVKLSNDMLKEYNNSRFFKWGLARAYQDIDKLKAIAVFNDLLNSVETIENRNQYNDIVLRHKIAMLYDELNMNNESLKYCNQILNFKIKSEIIKNRLSDRLKRTKELKERLLEKIGVNN